MQSFKRFITEMFANTDIADVNEIQLGYFLSNNWKNFVDASAAKKQLELKRKKVGDDEFETQSGRAETMAKEIITWSKKNGYNGKVSKVWWTARPNVLSKAVGTTVDSRKNPTDVLVQFSNGEFLGLSAKTTKTQGDIGFKNPGLGTVEKNLGVKIGAPAQEAIDKFMKEFDVSKSAASRKKEIRADAAKIAIANELGSIALNKIRDNLFVRLNKMDNKELMSYLLNDWMDAKSSYPRYIKVTGMKVGAKVEDPMANSKITALSTSKIKLTKVGNDSIGVQGGNKKVMKMRAKYESQKLASTIKFSGDPWK